MLTLIKDEIRKRSFEAQHVGSNSGGAPNQVPQAPQPGPPGHPGMRHPYPHHPPGHPSMHQRMITNQGKLFFNYGAHYNGELFIITLKSVIICKF